MGSSPNGDADRLGELKLQTSRGRHSDVLFARRINRIGLQGVRFSLDFDRGKRHGQFRRTLLLGGKDAAGYVSTLGNHNLPTHLNGRGEAGGKGITCMVIVAGDV